MLQKKVVIVAKDTNRYEGMPLGDRSFEFWGFNVPSNWDKDHQSIWDRWFELHQLYIIENRHYFSDYNEWLANHLYGVGKLPKYVWRPSDWKQVSSPISNLVSYPKKLVEDLSPHGYYHASSVDWILACAIAEGYEVIHLYGITESSGSEPISARACLEYWLGIAEGRGIEIHINSTDVFQYFYVARTERQYGYDNFTEHLDDLRVR